MHNEKINWVIWRQSTSRLESPSWPTTDLQISQIVRDTGLTPADACTVANDRSTWSVLQPTAGYTQQ